MTGWEVDWVSKVRKLAAAVCDFYVSPYFSSASLMRLEDGWAARFYFNTHFIEVYYFKEGKLAVRVWSLPYKQLLQHRDCEVKVDSLDLARL